MAEMKDLKSKEMKNFYRMLALVQTNAIFRVMRGKDAEEMKKLATAEITLLREAADNGHGCPAGTVWDEVSGGCVPIQDTIT